MTSIEQKTVNAIGLKQVEMETNQHYMSKDLQEMKDDIKEYGSKIGVTLKELTSINVVEPSKYYHEDEHDKIKENLNASSLSRPHRMPVPIVAPLLDMPGIRAMPCAIPITIEFIKPRPRTGSMNFW